MDLNYSKRNLNRVVKCSCIEEIRNEYLSKLRRKLEKIGYAHEDQIKTNKIVSYIRKFFNNETSFETNQELLSMTNVFRRIVVKIWAGNDFDARENRK